ncbi:hypothetical protein [Collimonas pratensis]|uniref:Uncharacterized protein n=1 Tax=Collimonas pratensis TaxID=279113 RepID=A0ABN4MIY6_9BURK|nr:hypothetical protein [Collimonas pratensis]AMP15622.1 hypothetical protein CPter291_3387 [Collimonas pratensis]
MKFIAGILVVSPSFYGLQQWHQAQTMFLYQMLELEAKDALDCR